MFSADSGSPFNHGTTIICSCSFARSIAGRSPSSGSSRGKYTQVIQNHHELTSCTDIPCICSK